MKITKYITEKAKDTEDGRVLRFIGSDNKPDRDGDIVDINGWDLKQYKKNPVVLFGHKYSETPVARTKKVWIEDNKLMFDIEFPEASVSAIGDSLYKLYKGGFMTATSVGFVPNYEKIEYPKNIKGAVRIIREQELLEISLVSVPANPRALLSNKSIDEAIRLDIIDNKELDQLNKWFDSFVDKGQDFDVEGYVRKYIDEIINNYKIEVFNDISKKIDEKLVELDKIKVELDNKSKDVSNVYLKDVYGIGSEGWVDEWIKYLK